MPESFVIIAISLGELQDLLDNDSPNEHTRAGMEAALEDTRRHFSYEELQQIEEVISSPYE